MVIDPVRYEVKSFIEPITLKESIGTGDGFLIVKINSRYVRELIVVCLGRGIYMRSSRY